MTRATSLALAVALIATATNARAQAPMTTWKPHFEFNVPGGVFAPTGDQRNEVKGGTVSAAQLSYVAHPLFALTATFGWARSRGLAFAATPKLDVLMYDLGAEGRLPHMARIGRATVGTFIAAGAGARTYSYRGDGFDTTHELAVYGGAGGEVGMGKVHLRLEARDYVTGNDVVVLAGIRVGR